MGEKKESGEAVKRISRWVRSRSVRELISMGLISGIFLLFLLRLFWKNQTYLFMATQIAHSSALLLLIYKLTITKTCSGIFLYFFFFFLYTVFFISISIQDFGQKKIIN